VTEISLQMLFRLKNFVLRVDDTWYGLTDVTKRAVGLNGNRFITTSGKIQARKYREELKLSARLVCNYILKRTSQI
jgi:hypothetical protein